MAASRRGSFVPGQRGGWRGLPGEVEPRVPLVSEGGWTSPGSKGEFVWGTQTVVFLIFRGSPRIGRFQGLGHRSFVFLSL